MVAVHRDSGHGNCLTCKMHKTLICGGLHLVDVLGRGLALLQRNVEGAVQTGRQPVGETLAVVQSRC